MSKFPAQFIDMAVERDLFDHTGAQPPSVRLSVELPPEYLDKPETGATPPYSDDRVDKQVLADVQTSVMREYGGAARRLLNAFRQDVGLGDLSVNGRKAMLGEGVGMSYVSQFGNESIRIHVSQQGVRYLLGEQNILMLVLYGDNKIAYVPMSSIASPAGKVSKKTLTQSNWAMPIWWRGSTPSGWDAFMTPFRIMAFQAKLSSVWHVLQANMSVSTEGVITIPASIEQTPVYNTKDTLLKKADSSTPRFTAIGETRFIYLNLAMNGENSTMYNDRGDKFTWSQSNGVLRESSYSDNYTDAYSQTMVMNVTKTGGRYSDILIELESNGYIKSYPITNSQSTAFGGVGSYADILGFFGPAESDFTYQTIPLNQGGTITTTAHISNYAKTSGGLDQINTGTTTVTYTFTPGANYYYPIPLGRYGDGWSYSIDGYFGYSNGRDYLDNNPGIWGAYPFPPSLGVTQDKVYYVSAARDTALPVSGFLQTPYERHDEPAFRRNWFQFAPWLHISNGKHVLQAYDWTNENSTTAHKTRIWLDGVNYGSTLAAAIGCSVDDIRLILFDIKKADIDKLK